MCLDSVRLAVQRYATTLYCLSQMTTLDIHYAHTAFSQLIEETEDAGFSDDLRGIVEKARKRAHLQIFQNEVTTQDGKARFAENPPLVSGYLGIESGPFVEAIVAFARAYADQSERDYDRLLGAIKQGDVPALSL